MKVKIAKLYCDNKFVEAIKAPFSWTPDKRFHILVEKVEDNGEHFFVIEGKKHWRKDLRLEIPDADSYDRAKELDDMSDTLLEKFNMKIVDVEAVK